MPVFNKPIKAFKANKDREVDYVDFSGGLNTIFKPTELKPNELAQADNLVLVGKGVPTGRPGSQAYFWAGTGYVRLLDFFRDFYNNVNEIFAITDTGYLVKKSGASYAVVTGASFASGYPTNSAQLGGFSYIVGGNKPMARFDGTNLLTYVTLPVPTGVGVSNISGATGTNTWSWRITAKNLLAETTGSVGISYASLPLNLTETIMNVKWDKITSASGGYNIYRGTPGNETFIGTVGPDTYDFKDYGVTQSDTVLPPNSNNTAGINGKYILRFDDRLVIAGVADDPTIVYISGRYPYHDRFHWADGGGYVRIAPDAGDEITGLAISGSQTQGGNVPASVLVFMKHSVHQLVLKSLTIGNYLVLDPQTQVLAPVGCTSHKTIKNVENNTFFLGREGLHTIGQEQAYLQQLRTRELSVKVRPYFRNLANADLEDANAEYIDYRYVVSFPNRKETMTYDFQRKGAVMGPWKTPWGITTWLKYFDSENKERWLAGTDSGYVKEFSNSLTSDSGTAIQKLLRTRKEDFGDWTVMKVIKTLAVLFRNVRGAVTVNIRLETRDGVQTTSKSFNITGSFGTAGWGTDLWGSVQWGDTDGTLTLSGEEDIRYTQLFKIARVLQVEVVSTGASSNWEFLGLKAKAQPLQEGSLSSDVRV